MSPILSQNKNSHRCSQNSKEYKHFITGNRAITIRGQASVYSESQMTLARESTLSFIRWPKLMGHIILYIIYYIEYGLTYIYYGNLLPQERGKTEGCNISIKPWNWNPRP